MFEPGDLVKVVDGWYLGYFEGKLGIIVGEALPDYFEEGNPPYYQVHYPNEGHHIMFECDLQLVSKVTKSNEVQGV